MSKAQPPAQSLPPARRAFEPARYDHLLLARAYLHLVPGPRRAAPARVTAAAAGATAAPRPAAAS